MAKNGDGLVAESSMNERNGSVVRTRSRIPLNLPFFNTYRFGEYSPFFFMEAVQGDRDFKHLSAQVVDSYTLKAPLMQNISMKKDLFLVPRQAILPLNWEKFITNPPIGEDVPDDCGSTVVGFWHMIYDWWYSYFFEPYFTGGIEEDVTPSTLRDLLVGQIRALLIGEMFFSNGSLLKSLGISVGSTFRFLKNDDDSIVFESVLGNDISYDRFVDYFLGQIAGSKSCFGVTFDGATPYLVSCDRLDLVSGQYLSGGGQVISFREFLDMFRDNLSNTQGFGISSISLDITAPTKTFMENVMADFEQSYIMTSFPLHLADDCDLDLARVAAYQIVCHHFYSNDHVDYIYSADLFRQYIGHCILNDGTPIPKFYVNGLAYQYDYLSAKCFDVAINDIETENTIIYLAALFTYRRSLRFVDYFAGAKTQPLAVGDTDVDVNANKVSVVDTVRNIQRQRFFNAVNRVGRKIEDYAKMMTGTYMAPDYHNPLYLGHTSDNVFGDRSEYTGNVRDSQQNNITSVLKNSGGRYQFQYSVDRDCIVIGICYFDIERVYTQVTERQVFHVNRFDMFNPFMQFIGDQSIYREELGIYSPSAGDSSAKSPFGYQIRHSEYKQRVPQAAGGFVENLPAWYFKAERGFRRFEKNISPSFIRSYSSEFDQFYVSLSGYSLGSYFHFIVKNINNVSVSRPMAATPQILQ